MSLLKALVILIAFASVVVFAETEDTETQPIELTEEDLTWVSTVAFCMYPDLFNQTDECLENYVNATKIVEGIENQSNLLDFWKECRREIYSTTNSTEASQYYCSQSVEDRKDLNTRFDTCLLTKDLDKEELERAILSC